MFDSWQITKVHDDPVQGATLHILMSTLRLLAKASKQIPFQFLMLFIDEVVTIQ